MKIAFYTSKTSDSRKAIIRNIKERKIEISPFLAAATPRWNGLGPELLLHSLCSCQGNPQTRVFYRNTAGCLKLFLLVIRKWNVIQVGELTDQYVISDVGVVIGIEAIGAVT